MPKANFDGSLRRYKVTESLLKILAYIPKEIDNGLLFVISPKSVYFLLPFELRHNTEATSTKFYIVGL